MTGFGRGKAGWLGGLGLLLLTGCGGGGGTNSTGTPPVASTGAGGTSSPTPTLSAPVATNYSDDEYRRSNAAQGASAISAWNAGATGTGQTIAILDSGLSDPRGEFSGRVSSASTSISDGAGYADQDGHGTAVAAVAAAARNGSDIEGVAFGATVMALRTDSTGTCGTTDGCKFNTNTLSNAVDYATQHGAKIINMSLGGGAATSQLKAALGRATTAGVIVVLAAGNDGDANPDALAQVAADPSAHGLVVIAGAHDASGAVSSFSDKAGSFAPYYISALGGSGTDPRDGVRAFDNKGTDTLWTGTSFAAPAVAASVALIEQAFPNLTPAQVVKLLFSSATDAGATGVDPIFGNGLLNLVKAFQPSGSLSLAGSGQPVSASGNAVLSTAMGDATLASAALRRAVALDALGRAYTIDMTGTAARVAQVRPLANAIAGNLFVRDRSYAGAQVSMTLARDGAADAGVGLAQRGLTPNSRATARALAGSATFALGRTTRVGMAFATSGRRIGDIVAGSGDAGSFLVARAPGDGPGFDGQHRVAMAVSHRIAGWTLDGAAERGTLPALLGREDRPSGYTLMTMRAGRRLGPLGLGLGGGVMDEEASMLGARFGPALGGGGARTLLADADLTLDLGQGWRARAQWRRGWSDPAAGGALAGGTLRTRASAFELGRAGATTRFGLRYAEPTRVTSGGLALSVPVSYDYASGLAAYSLSRLDLTPAGRERDVEGNVGLRVGGGWLDANLFWRRNPGNLLLAPDDTGAALRYGVEF